MASSSTTRPDGSKKNKDSTEKKKRKLPPSAPYIAFGAAWAAYAVAMPFYKIWHIIPAAFFAFIVKFIFSCLSEKPTPKPEKPKYEPPKKRIQEQAAQLDKYARSMRALAAEISDSEVRSYASSICNTLERISDNIEANPTDSKKSRMFTRNYVPTVVSVFERYKNLEAQEVEGGNIENVMNTVKDSLRSIDSVFKKQLDDMFDDDALDIKTDIDVLSSVMEGLK